EAVGVALALARSTVRRDEIRDVAHARRAFDVGLGLLLLPKRELRRQVDARERRAAAVRVVHAQHVVLVVGDDEAVLVERHRPRGVAGAFEPQNAPLPAVLGLELRSDSIPLRGGRVARLARVEGEAERGGDEWE